MAGFSDYADERNRCYGLRRADFLAVSGTQKRSTDGEIWRQFRISQGDGEGTRVSQTKSGGGCSRRRTRLREEFPGIGDFAGKSADRPSRVAANWARFQGFHEDRAVPGRELKCKRSGKNSIVSAKATCPKAVAVVALIGIETDCRKQVGRPEISAVSPAHGRR